MKCTYSPMVRELNPFLNKFCQSFYFIMFHFYKGPSPFMDIEKCLQPTPAIRPHCNDAREITGNQSLKKHFKNVAKEKFIKIQINDCVLLRHVMKQKF